MINYFSKYDPATLERLHQVQLEILKDADALCRKHGLNYFVSGGTAIGAIRHQGFIPWDDDIDICFPRADYEKFMQFAEQEMADKYDLLTPLNTAGYTLMFGRMSKKGTVFVADTDKQCTYKPGIFIDLFPYDKVPIDKKLRRKQIRKAWIWARLIVLRCYGNPTLPNTLTGWKRTLARIGCKLIHAGLVVCCVSKKWLYKRYCRNAEKYNKENTGLYTDLAYLYPERVLVYEKELYHTLDFPFEGLPVKVLSGYDRYLTCQYGDYMQLPPENERRNHAPHQLKFGQHEPYAIG